MNTTNTSKSNKSDKFNLEHLLTIKKELEDLTYKDKYKIRTLLNLPDDFFMIIPLQYKDDLKYLKILWPNRVFFDQYEIIKKITVLDMEHHKHQQMTLKPIWREYDT